MLLSTVAPPSSSFCTHNYRTNRLTSFFFAHPPSHSLASSHASHPCCSVACLCLLAGEAGWPVDGNVCHCRPHLPGGAGCARRARAAHRASLPPPLSPADASGWHPNWPDRHWSVVRCAVSCCCAAVSCLCCCVLRGVFSLIPPCVDKSVLSTNSQS